MNSSETFVDINWVMLRARYDDDLVALALIDALERESFRRLRLDDRLERMELLIRTERSAARDRETRHLVALEAADAELLASRGKVKELVAREAVWRKLLEELALVTGHFVRPPEPLDG